MRSIKLILSSCLFSSCIITNTPGFYSGYKKLTEEEKRQVVLLPDDYSICKLANDSKIYAINADQLLNCLANNDTTVVYFWSPNCSGKSCILVDACQELCKTKNYNLIVIAEYYDIEKMTCQNQNTLFPFFSINHKYYKTDYCNKYLKRFIKDLTADNKLTNDIYYSRFLVFKNKKLVKGINDL